MRPLRIYVDTSVIGGTQDEEFSEASNRLFAAASRGKITIPLSAEVVAELVAAPDAVRAVVDSLPTGSCEEVRISPEVTALAQAYIEAGILGSGAQGDATHVAAATMARADAIVSWNFRHIVNFDRIHRYNQVNQQKGYGHLEIRCPAEMVYDDPQEDI
jgi:hypothetical protein